MPGLLCLLQEEKKKKEAEEASKKKDEKDDDDDDEYDTDDVSVLAVYLIHSQKTLAQQDRGAVL